MGLLRRDRRCRGRRTRRRQVQTDRTTHRGQVRARARRRGRRARSRDGGQIDGAGRGPSGHGWQVGGGGARPCHGGSSRNGWPRCGGWRRWRDWRCWRGRRTTRGRRRGRSRSHAQHRPLHGSGARGGDAEHGALVRVRHRDRGWSRFADAQNIAAQHRVGAGTARVARSIDLEGRAALRAAHLEPTRGDPALVHLVGSFAARALDLEHVP